LIKEKIRCEQQSFFSVNPKDPIMMEKIILEKIKNKSWIE
jgi:DNA topoisomerase-6 subunit A